MARTATASMTIALFVSLAALGAERSEEQRKLRIVSYNVQKGTPVKAIAADLLALKADILALQEVDAGTRRSRGEDQPRLLREALGMHGHYAPSYAVDGGTTGMMVLSRWRLVKTQAITLRNSRDIGTVAVVATPGGAVRVYSVHLSATYRMSAAHIAESGKAREREAARIAELAAGSKAPVIVAGDLNASHGSTPYATLTRRLSDCAFTLGKPSPTFPRALPALRLDHVFVSEQLRPIRVETRRGASDHLMLVVDLAWKP